MADSLGEEQFIDQSNYQLYMGGGQNEKEISFKTILLEHVRRIAILSSKDFDEGGYVKKTTFLDQLNRPATVENYVPSPRNAFLNSVRFFRDLVWPFVLKKSKLKDNKIWLENHDSMKTALEKCIELDKKHAGMKTPPTPENMHELVEAYRALFLEINTFCAFNNYFGKQSLIE